jgi:alkanesulfonate monooxygenase SsuD/methylene tetrahydromethanopterin reductase-like flavin-dependent oxidoreductase (luciferase family)
MGGERVKIGMSIASLHLVRDAREGARRMVERTRFAAASGIDMIFFGDHHATRVPYYQNVPILGRCLAEWDERPAGALFLLPLWHPVLLAEQIGTLASIAEGPFIMQCGIGPDDHQFPAMGVSKRQRPSRFEQSLEIMRSLWAGETVQHDGHWKLENVRIAPLPSEPIEVWIGALAKPAIERAARMGDGWLANPGMTPETAREQLEGYQAACAAIGRPTGRASIRRDVYVGADPEAAQKVAAPILEAGHRGFPAGAAVVGSVEQVAEQFAALQAIGYSDVIVRNLVPDQGEALACIERLGRVRELLA